MNAVLKVVFAVAALLAPLAAFAQVGGHGSIKEIIDTATSVVTDFVPTGMMLILFLWIMFQVVANAGDAEKLKKARPRIIWGIIILFALFSLAGILAVLQQTFLGGTTQQESAISGGGGSVGGGGGGGGGSLVPSPGLTGCRANVEPDLYCEQDLGLGARCAADGSCIPPPPRPLDNT